MWSVPCLFGRISASRCKIVSKHFSSSAFGWIWILEHFFKRQNFKNSQSWNVRAVFVIFDKNYYIPNKNKKNLKYWNFEFCQTTRTALEVLFVGGISKLHDRRLSTWKRSRAASVQAVFSTFSLFFPLMGEFANLRIIQGCKSPYFRITWYLHIWPPSHAIEIFFIFVNLWKEEIGSNHWKTK